MLQIPGRDVKTFQGVGQSGRGQVTDQVVENAQPEAHLPGLLGTGHHVEAPGGFDEADQPPEATVPLHPGAPFGMTQQHPGVLPTALAQQGTTLVQSRLDMIGDGHHVGHHQFGLRKHRAVQALEHKALQRIPVADDQITVVDIAVAQTLQVKDRARKCERCGDGGQLAIGVPQGHGWLQRWRRDDRMPSWCHQRWPLGAVHTLFRSSRFIERTSQPPPRFSSIAVVRLGHRSSG